MKTLLITDSDFGTTDSNFCYLLGFQPTLGAIVYDTRNFIVFLDGRYFAKTQNINTQKIQNILGKVKISYVLVESSLAESINECLKDESHIKLSDNITLKYSQSLSENGLSFTTITNPFSQYRIIKSSEEKKHIKKAISIIDQVFIHIETLNKMGELIGKTEREIKRVIIQKIYKFGGEGESFSPIVAFGANSAIPHHETGETIISEGVLLVDCGALYKGYPSDCTRTYWVGDSPAAEFLEIYNIVKQAHLSAYENAHIGMMEKEVDNLARSIITDGGYGKYFCHRTGHGVGLDIHEAPFIGKDGETRLKNDMVFTIEPGMYLPGKFGIRLEDIVYFENDELKKWTSLDI